jgi:hypothetical protein
LCLTRYAIIFRNLIDLTVDDSQPWQLQPQFTSVAPQFTTVSSVYDPSAVQAQFTAFDPYAQQAQYEAMLQAEYARQQAEAAQQQQYYALQMQASQFQTSQYQPVVPQKTAVHGCVFPLCPIAKHRSTDVALPAQTTPLPKRLPQFPHQDPRTPIPRRLRAHLQHPHSCRDAHLQVPPSLRTRPRFPRVLLSHLVRRRWPLFSARVPGRAASTRSGTSERSATGALRLVMLRGSELARLLLCFHKISYTLFVCHDHLRPRFAPSPCIMSKHSPLFFCCTYYVLGCRQTVARGCPALLYSYCNCPSHSTVDIELDVCAAALMAFRSQVPSCRSQQRTSRI